MPISKPFSRDVEMSVASLHYLAEAIHRLRRAAFGTDREDRLADAAHFAAMYSTPKRRARRRARP
jgi:hypothetical protein